MKILVSQQTPKVMTPYEEMHAKYGADFEFVPFFKVEPLTSREFRAQRINVLDHTAIVLAAKSAVDAFFQLCEETRVKIPETMKYFCTSEAVAMYLQKYITYRKRKIFFGDGRSASIRTVIGSRHKTEKILVVTADRPENEITRIFDASGIAYDSAVFVKTVSADLKALDIDSYDVITVYNKADVASLKENFPGFEQGEKKFITFGAGVVAAMEQAGFIAAVSAPTPELPSAAAAIDHFLAGRQQG